MAVAIVHARRPQPCQFHELARTVGVVSNGQCRYLLHLGCVRDEAESELLLQEMCNMAVIRRLGGGAALFGALPMSPDQRGQDALLMIANSLDGRGLSHKAW